MVQYIIQFLKVEYLVLTVQVHQFFSEQILKSKYSTIHAIGLVQCQPVLSLGMVQALGHLLWNTHS